MIGNYISPLSGSRRVLLATLATSSLFVAGCSNMATSAPDVNPFTSAATLKGAIHGGNQPVSGATVYLYFAGQMPAAPALAATTTSANDGAGSFSFVQDPAGSVESGTTNHYACPAAAGNDPLVFVIAKGGNTVNDGNPATKNTAAAFIALFGNCKELTSANQIYMSEATSAATMAVVAQFFDPFSETITADGTGQQQTITNGLPSTVALLASSATGNAVVSTTLPAPAKSTSINPSIAVTATPETGKINLIANIISACINNASASATPCTQLFSAAAPPVPNTTNRNGPPFPAATDTLQALYYMFTNPASISSSSPGTANITTLYGLAGGAGAPYQPYLNTQPTDWTIAINYTSTGTCGTPTGGTGNFINSPIDIAVDAFNNVWFANSQAASGNLSELSAAGVPTTCVLPGTGAVGGITIDSLAFPSTNIWVGTTGGLFRYTAHTGASLLFPTASTNPVALGADGVGNLYFTAVSGTTGSLYQLPGAASNPTSTVTQISSTVGPNPIRIMPDLKIKATLNNIWVSSGANFVSQVAAGSGGTNGFVTTSHATDTNSTGLSITNGGNVYVSDATTSSVTQFALSGTTYSVPAGFPFSGTTAGVNGATALVIDPRFNGFIPNSNNGTSTGSLSEFSRTPVAISPSTGFQKAQTYLSGSSSEVIDQAGNLWIAGKNNAFLTEIVGVAVPVFQPYAFGLSNGRFNTIP